MASRFTRSAERCVFAGSAAFVLVMCAHGRAQTCDRVWINGEKGVGWASPSSHTTPPEILAAVTWDPDGTGPLGPWLVVAGSFDQAGGAAANNIAAWDGTTWHTFGSGTTGRVAALNVYQGELFAGGDFLNAGGAQNTQYLAAWNGSDWVTVEPLGQGQVVTGLTSDNDDLFVDAGNDVFRYNASSWTDITIIDRDLGLSYSYLHGVPQRADASSGTYAVSAGFSGFTNSDSPAGFSVSYFDGSWNDANWDSAYKISALKYIGGPHYAGGRGPTGSPFLRQSGSGWSWSDVGIPNSGQGELTAIGIHGAIPAVALAFFPGSGAAQYNETLVYDIVNGGPAQLLGAGFFDDRVDGLVSFNGVLHAFGKFQHVGQVVCNGLAQFDGTNWVAVGAGFDAPPLALASWRGELWAGGTFASIGGMPTPNLARLTSGAWQAVGPPNGPIWAMQSWNAPFPLGSLVVGGDFTQIESVVCSHIAQVGFTTAFTLAPLGSGLSARPRVITPVVASTSGVGVPTYNLIVGGEFTASGAITLNHVGRWTGSVWQPLGTGVNGTVSAVTSSGAAAAPIIVGGEFSTAGGLTAPGVASWNPTTSTWSAMGAGLNAPVRALAMYNGVLYAGGEFTASGATPLRHLALWTGSAWQQVGTGLDSTVYALIPVDSDLAVGGAFVSDINPADPALNHFALWNGSSYRPLGDGQDGTVSALVQNSPDLFAAGIFTTHLAQAAPASAPTVYAYTPQAACLDSVAPLSAYPTNCAGGTYHWRRNGIALADGLDSNGTIIQGSSTLNLSITSTTHADEGLYDVVINCPCGNATSTPISLAFETPPYVALEPADGVFCIGGPLALAALGGGTEPLHYVWTKNGIPIPNGLSDVVVIPAATAADAGTYSCSISSACGVVTTRTVSRTVATGPRITSQPQPATGCAGGQATFTVAASNAADATYQWYQNNVPLIDSAPSAMSSGVAGSATPVLRLSQIVSGAAGYYQCDVATACEVMSAEALLTVSPGSCCPADFNNSGTVNVQDIFAFLGAWFAGDPRADFNGMNGITVQDIFAFLAAWFAGC